MYDRRYEASRPMPISTSKTTTPPFEGVYQPVRIPGVVYQNTSGKNMLVSMNIQCDATGIAVVMLGSTSPPLLVVGQSLAGENNNIAFIVPPNWYYEVLQNAATVTIGVTTEFYS